MPVTIPMLEAEITELKDQLHYCKGTADLAMKHRDIAETEVAKLRAALQWYAQRARDGEVARKALANEQEGE